ncbi:MAG: 4Fe-4S binding protein [Eubacterium sp.]|nr:4Fe-4S binding protein [Eubacterium sp.]
MKKRKAVINRKQCVACGCCMKVCPRNAITIPKGIHADVNRQLCVGCGKCAAECPASVISFEVLEVADS